MSFRRKNLSAAVHFATLAFISSQANAQLEEVIVTATKRAALAQDIPVSVQALGGESLQQLGVSNFDEYVQFLPNVVQQGRGPGQSEIYIRGIATEQSNNTVSSVQGSSPAVALYVDEQPVSFGGRNLDIYTADMARVEVLPGPQGTLFGASSQSGTVRLITNKPSIEGFSAGFRGDFGSTKGGEFSTSTEGFINIPLSDTIAVRAVLYNDNQGGWIDNVRGSFNSNDQELINVMNRNQIFAAGIADGATLARPTNEDLIKDDFNDATYKGARFGFSWLINEDWDVLVQHAQQQLETEGSFEYSPVLNDEEKNQIYSPNFNDDEFGLTTWTLNGRLAGLDLVYTGGFLNREVNQISDYTLYTFGGGYQVYYICNGGTYTAQGECFDPRKQYLDSTDSERTTHEFRITTDAAKRWRITAGVYYDEVETQSIGQFQYFGAVEAGFNSANIPGPRADRNSIEGVNNFSARGEITTFQNDFTREEDQLAFFGEIGFDITDDLTLTVGARHYDIDFSLKGATGSSFGCKGFDVNDAANAGDDRIVSRPDGSLGCDGNGNNVTQRLRDLGVAGETADLGSDGVANESDTITKVTLGWHAAEDVLLYATYSQGFRPLVTNRNAGAPSGNQSGVFAGYVVPAVATTDELTNFEVGIKSEWLDGNLRINATYYDSEVEDLQTTRFDPSNIAFLVFIENIGDADVNGIDLDFQWAASPGLLISGAASYVDSEITSLNPQLEGIAVPKGSELPFTAEFSANLRARYEWDMLAFGGEGFVQGSAVYTGDRKAGIIGNAFLAEDTARRIYGTGTGLKIEDEGGTHGSTAVATASPGSFGLTTDADGATFFKNGRYVAESYVTFNLSAGVRKDSWLAELYVNNVSDENAVSNISTFDYIPTVTPIRPRTVGFRVSYDFE